LDLTSYIHYLGAAIRYGSSANTVSRILPPIEIGGYGGTKSAFADCKTCAGRFVSIIAHHFNGGLSGR
ncbi:MAG: hypothetical protein RMM08_13920, partial [Armatimonadota bacterium]|nr:hypothetical protein [Armatimonadota bacterium]